MTNFRMTNERMSGRNYGVSRDAVAERFLVHALRYRVAANPSGTSPLDLHRRSDADAEHDRGAVVDDGDLEAVVRADERDQRHRRLLGVGLEDAASFVLVAEDADRFIRGNALEHLA